MTTIETHNTTADTVIQEVRRAKEHLASQYDFDVRRIAAASRAEQVASGHEVVSRSRDAAFLEAISHIPDLPITEEWDRMP